MIVGLMLVVGCSYTPQETDEPISQPYDEPDGFDKVYPSEQQIEPGLKENIDDGVAREGPGFEVAHNELKIQNELDTKVEFVIFVDGNEYYRLFAPAREDGFQIETKTVVFPLGNKPIVIVQAWKDGNLLDEIEFVQEEPELGIELGNDFGQPQLFISHLNSAK